MLLKSLHNGIRLSFIFVSVLWSEGNAASILLHKKDAVVWHPQQTISGEIVDLEAESVTVYYNEKSFSVDITAGQKFSFQLMLRDPVTKIWVDCAGVDPAIVSDTLHLSLGYTPTPLVKPSAKVIGESVQLQASTIKNPYDVPLQYVWSADSSNPAVSNISNPENVVATVTIPDVDGKYFYNLLVVAEEDSVWFQTMVTREDDKLEAFDIDADYPAWMDEAIIYQITPYNFVANGTFPDITAKLPEIKQLGINTIWLQPIYKSSYRGQGYDVVDYLSINPAFGTESELGELIREAKSLELRVLFDIVLNHTSIKHPYAQDVIAQGEDSPYYDFYQHEHDGKPYSSFYNTDENGFVYYFWEDLVNLNYDNEEVQRWMLEVCKYWIREFDIDGYRFDAIWGVNSRMPSFAERLRTELKAIKPDVLLLAEDKGTEPEVFELGFDAAYDWTTDTSWVSQTSWEYEYDENESKTIYNHSDVDYRDELLREALFMKEDNEHKILRYMENNDLHRFINGHGLKRTKMAAALLFALPGIPMLYNGQETGFREHPYSTNAIFNRNWTISAADKEGLFPYYQKLIQLHKQYPALSDTAMEELSVSPDAALVAFRRSYEDQKFVIVVNLDSLAAEATVDLSDFVPDEPGSESYWLRDVLTENTYDPGVEISNVEIPMEGYSVRWLLLEEGEATGAIDKNNKNAFEIYPNPSKGAITINIDELKFNKIRVIDMLGTIVFEEHVPVSDSKHLLHMTLPSTMYLLEISGGKEVLTTRIVIQ